MIRIALYDKQLMGFSSWINKELGNEGKIYNKAWKKPSWADSTLIFAFLSMFVY